MRLSLLLAAAFACALPAGAAEPAAPVAVIGALHGLHAREPDFGYAALAAAIVAFRPDVLVLEVRPDELAERKQTPGRPEYPAVLWPLLARSSVAVHAMEPGGAAFAEMAGKAGAAFKAFEARDPEGAKALARVTDSFEAALVARWRTPADTQDAATAAAAEALQTVQFTLVGPDLAEVQRRWDGHMASRAVEAARAAPNKRVLVLASYRNRAGIEARLRAELPSRVVAVQSVLEPSTAIGEPRQ